VIPLSAAALRRLSFAQWAVLFYFVPEHAPVVAVRPPVDCESAGGATSDATTAGLYAHPGHSRRMLMRARLRCGNRLATAACPLIVKIGPQKAAGL
jgi:hypothetical protein